MPQKPKDPDAWLSEKQAQLDPDVWLAEQMAAKARAVGTAEREAAHPASRFVGGIGTAVRKAASGIPSMLRTAAEGPIAPMRFAYQALTGQMPQEIEALRPSYEGIQKAGAAAGQGRYLEATGELGGAFPLLGPQAKEIGEEIARDPYAGSGELFGTLGIAAIPFHKIGTAAARAGRPLPSQAGGIYPAAAETSEGIAGQIARTEAGAGGFPIAAKFVRERDPRIRAEAERLAGEAAPAGTTPVGESLQGRARVLTEAERDAAFRAEEARKAANLAERQQFRGKSLAERGALEQQQLQERMAYEDAQRLLMGQAAESYAPGVTRETAGQVIAPALKKRAFYKEPTATKPPVQIEPAAAPGTLAAPTPEQPLSGLPEKPTGPLRGAQQPEKATLPPPRTALDIENQIREQDARATADLWLEQFEGRAGNRGGELIWNDSWNAPNVVTGRTPSNYRNIVKEIDAVPAGDQAKANAIKKDADNPLFLQIIDSIKKGGTKLMPEDQVLPYSENAAVLEAEQAGKAMEGREPVGPSGFDVFDEAIARAQGAPPMGSIPQGVSYDASRAELVDSITRERVPWTEGADPAKLIGDLRSRVAAENAAAMREQRTQVPTLQGAGGPPMKPPGGPIQLPAIPMKGGKVHTGKIKYPRDVESKVWNEIDRVAEESNVQVAPEQAASEAYQPSKISREAWERIKTVLSPQAQQLLSRLVPMAESGVPEAMGMPITIEAARGTPMSWGAARQGYSALGEDIRRIYKTRALGTSETHILEKIQDALGEDIDRAASQVEGLKEAIPIGRQLTTYRHQQFERGPARAMLKRPEETGALEPSRIGEKVPRMSEEKFRSVRESVGPQPEAQKALKASVVRDIYEQSRAKGATEAGAVDYQKALKILENKKYRTMLGEKGYADLKSKIQVDMARGQKIAETHAAQTKATRSRLATEAEEMRAKQATEKAAQKVTQPFEAGMQNKFVEAVAKREPERIVPDLLSLKSGEPRVTAAKRLRAMIGQDQNLLRQTHRAVFEQSVQDAIKGKTAGQGGVVVGPEFAKSWANTRQMLEGLEADPTWLKSVDEFAAELAKHKLSERVAAGPSGLGAQIQKGVVATLVPAIGKAFITGKGWPTVAALGSYVITPKLFLKAMMEPTGPRMIMRALRTQKYGAEAGKAINIGVKGAVLVPKAKQKEARP